jgi:hypothetical protein
MKQVTLSILAPAILAVGVAAAAAQSAAYYDSNALDYSMNALFLNTPPRVISVAGLPTPALLDLEPLLQGAIGTDGSGKIDGVQYARVYFGGAGDHTNNYATFVINVTGTIRTSGTAPVVKMTLKGNGYDVDAQTDHPNASLTLKFNSTEGPATVSPNQAVAVNSTNYTVTYLNGSPVLLTTNVPTPYSGYYVNPINYAVTFFFTNGPATFRNNNPYAMVSGRLTGNIKPGKKSTVNGGKTVKVDEAAMLFTESLVWTVVNDTNFVQQTVGGSLVVNLLSNITVQVVQPVPGTKLYLVGGVGSTLDPYSGTGTVNDNQATYKAKLKGVSFARGAVLDINGTLGPVIIGYQPTTNVSFPTGYVTNRVQNAIKQISFSGKAVGQKVPLTSGVNRDAPFPSVP